MRDQPTEILNSSGEGYLTWPQPFMIVEQMQAQIASLTAENERLRALVESAYKEGWADSALSPSDDLYIDWLNSTTRAALQPKEVE